MILQEPQDSIYGTSSSRGSMLYIKGVSKFSCWSEHQLLGESGDQHRLDWLSNNRHEALFFDPPIGSALNTFNVLYVFPLNTMSMWKENTSVILRAHPLTLELITTGLPLLDRLNALQYSDPIVLALAVEVHVPCLPRRLALQDAILRHYPTSGCMFTF